MAIRIIVDSSADMEEDYAAEHDITIIPMTNAFCSDLFAVCVELAREESAERQAVT